MTPHPPQPGKTAGGQRVVLQARAGGGVGQQLGTMPLSARPAAAEMDMGQSQALPRKRSSGCSPCPSVIPLFLAPWRLSDKVHVDERAVWHVKSLHLTTETSQGRMAAHPVPQVHGGSRMPAQNPERTGASQPLRCPGAEGAWESTSCLDAQQGLGRHCPSPTALAQMPAVEGPGAHSPCSLHDAPLCPCQHLQVPEYPRAGARGAMPTSAMPGRGLWALGATCP